MRRSAGSSLARGRRDPLSQRQRRVGSILRRALSEELLRGGRFSARLTISEVRPSPDLRHARVFVQSDSRDALQKILKELEESRGDFQKILARRLQLRYTPRLSFVEDAAFEKAQRLERVFKSPRVAADISGGGS